jgi:hypothetical protein
VVVVVLPLLLVVGGAASKVLSAAASVLPLQSYGLSGLSKTLCATRTKLLFICH